MVNKSKVTKALSFILLLIVLTLNVTMVSALEFDNVKSYDRITREATIINAYGLGDEIGKARLNTPLNVKVPAGKNRKVAEFDLWAYDDYDDAIKQFTFTDLKKDVKINKDYNLKYLAYEEIKINDYAYDCYDKIIINKYNFTNSSPIETTIRECEEVIIGTHVEIKEIWKEVIVMNLKKNKKLTIGVFVDVELGEYVDWIPTIYGVKIEEWASYEGTGGTVTTDGDYTVHTFTENGIFGWTGINLNVSALVVGGGGSGGGQTGNGLAGGGGAGGLIYMNSNFTVSEQNYSIIIGLGGTGVNGQGNNGGNSSFSTLNANGGGGGAIANGGGNSIDGNDGGSGGGAGQGNALAGSGGTATPTGQGYNGGACGGNPSLSAGGGGGGAGEVGQDCQLTNIGGIGGDGLQINISGTLTYYAGGGGGGAVVGSASGGLGGGGVGGEHPNSALMTQGTDGLGGGGGGSAEDVAQSGGDGGDGVVIIRYFSPSPDKNPIIILNSPSSTNFTTPQILQINFTAYDGFNLTNVQLYVNTILNQSNASGINNSDYIFDLSLGDGDYIIYGTATDNESQQTNSSSIRIVIDSTLPQIINITPNTTTNYFLIGNNETLNFTVTDTRLDSCWFNYNGTNITIEGCLSGVENSTIFLYELGNNNITIYANDSFGNLNFTTTSWIYRVTEINQIYNNKTTEGSLETFLANIRLGSGLSITDAVLFSYNDSMTTGQSFISGLNTVLRKADLLIPNVETDTNITFYWDITLSDSTKINLSSKNQTIYNLDLDNCSTYTKELFNFTVVSEEKQLILSNATMEIAINVYDKTRNNLIMNYSKLFEKLNPLRICINGDFNKDSTYSVDTVVRYEEKNHANEYYNIANQSLTNNTESQQITLYDLSLNDSTEFQLTFTGSDFLPIENALVYVDRQYISENTFKTVELPKTDYNGQSVLHLVRNDVIYNIRIIKDGVVLGNFENLVAFCDDFTIGDCNIELNAFDSVESIFNVDETLGIIYTTPVYNETANTISFNFVTTDGTAKTVLLSVTRNDIFGNSSICNSSLISSGGTLTCNIDPNLDESVLVVSVYVDGVLTVSGSVELDTDNYGVAGYLVMFVMAMSFIFMFSGSKTGVLISIGLTFAGSLGMGIVSGNLIGIGASGIWLLVIIFVGIYKLNKERQS